MSLRSAGRWSHLITMQSRSRTFNDAITVVWLAEPVFRSADLIGIRGERERERAIRPEDHSARSATAATTTVAQSARSPSAIASFIESPPPRPLRPPRPPPLLRLNPPTIGRLSQLALPAIQGVDKRASISSVGWLPRITFQSFLHFGKLLFREPCSPYRAR